MLGRFHSLNSGFKSVICITIRRCSGEVANECYSCFGCGYQVFNGIGSGQAAKGYRTKYLRPFGPAIRTATVAEETPERRPADICAIGVSNCFTVTVRTILSVVTNHHASPSFTASTALRSLTRRESYESPSTALYFTIASAAARSSVSSGLRIYIFPVT